MMPLALLGSWELSLKNWIFLIFDEFSTFISFFSKRHFILTNTKLMTTPTLFESWPACVPVFFEVFIKSFVMRLKKIRCQNQRISIFLLHETWNMIHEIKLSLVCLFVCLFIPNLSVSQSITIKAKKIEKKQTYSMWAEVCALPLSKKDFTVQKQVRSNL